MQLVTKFDILSKVNIVEIKQPATVINIQYSGVRVQYQLEYWWNSEIKTVWLFENEVAALENKESAPTSTNSTKAKIVTSPHCIMNYCAMCEAECVADKQHCPYDQRGKT